MPDTEIVDVLAAQIRDTFILEMRKQQQERRGTPSVYSPSTYWDGGVDPGGIRRTAIWPRIAAKVLKEGYDPEAFVRAQFERYAQLPVPSVLLSARAVERYQQELAGVEGEMQQAYSWQLAEAETSVACAMQLRQISEIEAWPIVLWNMTIDLSALFRYCVVSQLRESYGNLPSLAKLSSVFRGAAAVQYRKFPLIYDRIWKDFIPASFRDQSAELAAEALNEGATK